MSDTVTIGNASQYALQQAANIFLLSSAPTADNPANPVQGNLALDHSSGQLYGYTSGAWALLASTADVKSYVDSSVASVKEDTTATINSVLSQLTSAIEANGTGSTDAFKDSIDKFSQFVDGTFETQQHAASTFAPLASLNAAISAINAGLSSLSSAVIPFSASSVKSGDKVPFPSAKPQDANYVVDVSVVDSAATDSFYQVKVTKKEADGITFKILQTNFDTNNGSIGVQEAAEGVGLDITVRTPANVSNVPQAQSVTAPNAPEAPIASSTSN